MINENTKRIGYRCPVCRQELSFEDKSYRCPAGHTFDRAKEGYVNLALRQADSGDNAAMCRSRQQFLNAPEGYYAPFADLLGDALRKYGTVSPVAILDAGCGEGYYLRRMREQFPDVFLCGIDLAKDAVKLAAKAEKARVMSAEPGGEGGAIAYAVAGIFDLPYADGSFDAVLSVFAPVGDAENRRVLKKDGLMLVAGPGKRHLSGLKSALYETPYDNPEKHREYEGFTFLGALETDYEVSVKKDVIADLFTMTPYYWKTSPADAEKLKALEELPTELSFVVQVYRRN